MKRIVTIALLLAFACPVLASEVAAPSSTINLPVELKDPFMAYTMGTIPFGSLAAGNYVGTSRLSWRSPYDVSQAAWGQLGFDSACIVGVIASNYMQQAWTYSDDPNRETASAMFALTSLASFTLIPLAHYLVFGPFWGDKAVNINKEKIEDAGFQP